MVSVRDTPHGASFAVRVQPRAKKAAITGVLGDDRDAALKIALPAPPIEGRANEALIEFLAKVLDVPRSAVQLVSGPQSRNKVVRVVGRTAKEISAALTASLTRAKPA